MTQGIGGDSRAGGAAGTPRPGSEIVEGALASKAPVSPYEVNARGGSPASPQHRRNLWGRWALGVSIVAVVLGFFPIPVLNVALAVTVAVASGVLGVVALWQPRRPKAIAIAALVVTFVAVVGSVVMAFVYGTVLVDAIGNAR